AKAVARLRSISSRSGAGVAVCAKAETTPNNTIVTKPVANSKVFFMSFSFRFLVAGVKPGLFILVNSKMSYCRRAGLHAPNHRRRAKRPPLFFRLHVPCSRANQSWPSSCEATQRALSARRRRDSRRHHNSRGKSLL